MIKAKIDLGNINKNVKYNMIHFHYSYLDVRNKEFLCKMKQKIVSVP